MASDLSFQFQPNSSTYERGSLQSEQATVDRMAWQKRFVSYQPKNPFYAFTTMQAFNDYKLKIYKNQAYFG
jgi:hypothetical protein